MNRTNHDKEGSDMKIKEVKRLHDAGIIESLRAVRSPSKPKDWYIQIVFDNSSLERPQKPFLLHNSLGEDKMFRRLNTLLGEIESITGEFYQQIEFERAIDAQGDMFL
jgi:hypothetical protein